MRQYGFSFAYDMIATMKNEIVKKLNEIEKSKHIKILYAVESGSRGWGFESRDSDYDVRFIYIHSLDWYLSINEGKDVIEYPPINQLDIGGWDIKKALKLFNNSNPPLYEWLNSPIVYVENGSFIEKLRKLIPQFYSPVSSIYHYLSMAKGNYKAYLTDQKVKIKKYFYVLRPIFACMWIELYKSIPPMEFKRLFKKQKLDQNVTTEVQELLKRKRAGQELDQRDKIKILDDFLKEKIQYYEGYAKKLDHGQHTKDNLLDKLFTDTLMEIWT